MLAVVEGGSADPRSNVRANVFLAATLIAAGNSRPVRIRNISSQGALLDGPALPPEGSIVHLRRGSLSVDGEVAWQMGDQCGLHFETDVVVTDWVRRIEHRGQEKVDRIIALLRAAPAAQAHRAEGLKSNDSPESIASELQDCVQRLAGLPGIVADHSDELLQLDSIVQRLRRLGEWSTE
jgi:hypothetical protein